MKSYEPYGGDWMTFVEEIDSLIAPSVLSKNFKFIKECWDWGCSPKRAVGLLIKKQRMVDVAIN